MDVSQSGIKALSQQQIVDLLAEMEQPAFRAKQLVQWIYGRGASTYDEMTNLSKALRQELSEKAPLRTAEIIDKQVSKDGTRKYVVQFYDGAAVEMVAMPYEDRMTVCFSTQVGCPMACSFCATGKEGFTRNLLPGEMLDQIIIAEKDMNRRVSNLVGMGQGEPLLNYDNVMAALRFANSKDGRGIGARHITISTCGILKGIDDFSREKEQFTLAVSLHSAIQETRDELMPKVANQPLFRLKSALQTYVKRTGRRATLEYIMINGYNDDDDHLDALVDFCDDLLCHVNLIPLNNIEGSPWQPSSKKQTQKFLNVLNASGTEATLRDSRGADIDGACGQLKNKRKQ
ncbi:Ribosomal RNA large subunit methyltransferase N [Slackia heliotrinireducens]|uniref:Probable dual-specificity RNA methyltransferase RlmN n=1 Tax=Slackia heliotrinireducens (strain ATCC 29202 / DSM 20476 / NCTC 11029 / RHS 1) TaxID=471855 RepID=C7N497_SLAHD|nr:23S rRNA (adenine(2503)-C(2))-methyltransferase RlmN [Slackia heliotrinireducens]ACV23833.1 radical SAM enzyme, Cfr family [Slackia heliotrinireducens DSM 20476]VEH03537.1 Ribosomal RNA large subunit methyltransferase N [Slackia heliotrinireducens]